MAASQGNERIGRNAHEDEVFHLEVACLNLANAARDDKELPLVDRLPLIIERLKTAKRGIDVLVCLEAGSPSKGVSWTTMAAQLETALGLQYIGVRRINATAMSFGKAFFVNPKTAAVSSVEQIWTASSGNVFDGDYFGNDCLQVDVHPVVSSDFIESNGVAVQRTQVIRNVSARVAFFHFPMAKASRMQVAQWIVDRCNAQVLMGDFNTFSDDGGPEQIEEIKGERYGRLPLDDDVTFNAFPHDIVKMGASSFELLNKKSRVVSTNEDGSVNVLPSSTLDHVFVKRDQRDYFECMPGIYHGPLQRVVATEESYILPTEGASDHAAIVAQLMLF